MKKKTLSNKEIRELNEGLIKYNFQFEKKENVEIIEDKLKAIKSNNEIVFFYDNDELIPSLKPVLSGRIILKKIAVDMGAVKFVVNGADIMRPGIVEIDQEIEKDGIIAIVDKVNKKPLAIGKALLNSDDMRAATSGKVIKNIHYIGDEIWKMNEL